MEDTLHLVAEVIRIMTTEAVLRASRQAYIEEETEVRVCHVEKILPQLVSDGRGYWSLPHLASYKFMSTSFLLF
jgi:hypothetical protein